MGEPLTAKVPTVTTNFPLAHSQLHKKLVMESFHHEDFHCPRSPFRWRKQPDDAVANADDAADANADA